MWQSFSAKPDVTPFNHLPANVDLNDKNVAQNEAAKKSEAFDFSKEDNIPDIAFNQVLWQGLKGKNAPAPSRAAFVKVNKKKDADD